MPANPNQPNQPGQPNQGQPAQQAQQQAQQGQGNVPPQLQQHQAQAQALGIDLANLDRGKIATILRFLSDLLQYAP